MMRYNSVEAVRRLAALILGAGLIVMLPAAAGAIVVTPTALYIDHQTRSGTLTLINNSDRPAEISIRFMFGYPTSDEEGRIRVDLLDAAPDGEPAATEWLHAFPRRLVLEPGQRQLVRIMVRPPEDLPDGEYWARAVVTSRGTQAPIEQRQGDVQVRLQLETAFAIAVTYRKGEVETGLRLDADRAELSGDGILLDLDLAREGNAAYLGRVRGRVLDAEGTTVAEFRQNIAVYRDMRRRINIPFEESPAGTEFTIEYVIEPQRPDLPRGGPLPAADIHGSLALTADLP